MKKIKVFLIFALILSHEIYSYASNTTASKKNRTILFFGVGLGGVDTHLKNLVYMLKKDKFKIMLLAKNNGFAKEWCRLNHVQHIKFKTNKEISKVIKETPCDIFHINHSNSTFPQLALLRKIKPNTKFICTFHGSQNELEESTHAKFIKNLKLYDICTFVDFDAIKKIEYLNQNSKKKINAVWTPPLHDDQMFNVAIKQDKQHLLKSITESLSLEHNPFIITVPAARISKNKNQACAIKALAVLIKNYNINSHLILLGVSNYQPDETKKILDMIQELNIENNVHLAGYRNDMHDILYHSDIIAIPSISESYGLPIIEGALLKKSIVVSNSIRAAHFFIKNNETGLSFMCDDHRDLAYQIMRIYKNKSLATQLGLNAFFKAKTEFSTQKLYNNFKNIYMSLNISS